MVLILGDTASNSLPFEINMNLDFPHYMGLNDIRLQTSDVVGGNEGRKEGKALKKARNKKGKKLRKGE